MTWSAAQFLLALCLSQRPGLGDAGPKADAPQPATAVLPAKPEAAPGKAESVTNPVAATAAGEDAAETDPGVPVRFRDQVLLVVHAPTATLSTQQRVAAIESRIADLAHRTRPELQDQRTVDHAGATDVIVAGTVVVSIRDADAKPAGQTREQLAATFSQRLNAALERDFKARTLHALLASLGYAALATLLLALLLLGVRWGFPKVKSRLETWHPGWIPTLSLGGVPLLSARRVADLAGRVAVLLRFTVVALALVIYGNAVLSFFPWTRGFAKQFAGFVLHAVWSAVLAVVHYLPNLVYLALIILAARWVLRLLKLAAEEMKKGALKLSGFQPEWADPTYKIVRLLVLALGVVVAFPYLPGSKSPAFQGISIFVGCCSRSGRALRLATSSPDWPSHTCDPSGSATASRSPTRSAT
jgi:hypothetical protein